MADHFSSGPSAPDRVSASSLDLAAARARLCLALDVDTLDEAVVLAARVHPFVGTVKVGLELYLAEGARAVAALGELGLDVFLDLKLHDIPTTVERSARVVARLGARYLTVHTSGGEQMVRAAVEGLAAGAAAAGVPCALAVGVTVLTSDPEAPPAELERRAAIAWRGGCGAVVCAAGDLAVTRSAAPGLLAIVPGIRPAGSSADDQQRITTPADAVALGADLLVIGRPISRAADPAAAAYAIASSLIGA